MGLHITVIHNENSSFNKSSGKTFLPILNKLFKYIYYTKYSIDEHFFSGDSVKEEACLLHRSDMVVNSIYHLSLHLTGRDIGWFFSYIFSCVFNFVLVLT